MSDVKQNTSYSTRLPPRCKASSPPSGVPYLVEDDASSWLHNTRLAMLATCQKSLADRVTLYKALGSCLSWPVLSSSPSHWRHGRASTSSTSSIVKHLPWLRLFHNPKPITLATRESLNGQLVPDYLSAYCRTSKAVQHSAQHGYFKKCASFGASFSGTC